MTNRVAQCTPWRTGSPASNAVFDDNGYCIAIAEGAETTIDEDIAHARLIAAAPDLYAALKLLHDNCVEYSRINNLNAGNNQDLRIARAALAKVQAP